MEPAPPARLRFPKLLRLTRAGEFRRVKERGRTYPGRHLVLGVLAATADPRGGAPTGPPPPAPAVAAAHAPGPSRGGIIVSRRVGPAVVRNRVRRRLRELFRTHRPRLRPGWWLVWVARPPAARATWEELGAEWLRLLRRAGIVAADSPLVPAPPRDPVP